MPEPSIGPRAAAADDARPRHLRPATRVRRDSKRRCARCGTTRRHGKNSSRCWTSSTTQRRSAPIRSTPVPLAIHARYTRDEALLALGDGSFERPPTSREGVRWLERHPDGRLLRHACARASAGTRPSTRYRDYALSPGCSIGSRRARRARTARPAAATDDQREDGTNVLLFVRENPTLANGAGAPFTLLGPATLGRAPRRATDPDHVAAARADARVAARSRAARRGLTLVQKALLGCRLRQSSNVLARAAVWLRIASR